MTNLTQPYAAELTPGDKPARISDRAPYLRTVYSTLAAAVVAAPPPGTTPLPTLTLSLVASGYRLDVKRFVGTLPQLLMQKELVLSTEQSGMWDFISRLHADYASESTRRTRLEAEAALADTRAAELHESVQSAVAARQAMETTMLSKFLVVLNAKKEAIAELHKAVGAEERRRILFIHIASYTGRFELLRKEWSFNFCGADSRDTATARRGVVQCPAAAVLSIQFSPSRTSSSSSYATTMYLRELLCHPPLLLLCS